MALIVEDGTGLYEANGYASLSDVRDYLTKRNRTTAWNAASLAIREAAIIAATDYIDRRFGSRFKGIKQYLDLDTQAYDILDFEANAQNNDVITIGATVYTYRTAISDPFDVEVGVDIETSISNLVDAINLTPGGAYGAGTTAHPDVTAELLESGTDMIIRAIVAGSDGNGILVSSNDVNLIWGTSQTANGYLGTEQYLEWPRREVYSRAGILVVGIPQLLKAAVAEYAERALSAPLLPDPVVDASGVNVVTTRSKVGPLERQFQVLGSGHVQILRSYPAADAMLTQYLNPASGRAIRG